MRKIRITLSLDDVLEKEKKIFLVFLFFLCLLDDIPVEYHEEVQRLPLRCISTRNVDHMTDNKLYSICSSRSMASAVRSTNSK